MEGLLVYLQQEFPWPALIHIPFKSFLFCLEISIVHGLISSNFNFHTFFFKSALSIFFHQKCTQGKEKNPFAASDVLLLLPSVNV